MKIYFDGACYPWNPGGIASYGYVLLDGESVVLEGKGVIGKPGTPESTNNVAEYTGLLKAIDALAGLGVETGRVEIRGDSQLVIRQLEGVYSVKAEHLKALHGKVALGIANLRARGRAVLLEWVPREQNAHADRLSNEAIDEYLKNHPNALDEIVLSFGKHKGTAWKDVPAGYREWLLTKR